IFVGLLIPGWPRGDRSLGQVSGTVTNDVPHPCPAHHLPARMAAGVDGDHHHLRADLPTIAEGLQHRPDHLRHSGGVEHPNVVQHTADGDGRVLSERDSAAACEADGDIRRLTAVRVPRFHHDGCRLHLPGDCALAATEVVRELRRMAEALTSLTATEAHREITRGALSSEEYVTACLDQIEALDGDIRAFVHIDRAHALKQARELDEWRRDGRPTGPLHGIPVAIKDIFDTRDYPTECGSPLLAGRRPRQDSTVVAKLRAAGAGIIGKAVTTDCAYYHPGPTRNPHNLEHTPGGSSSGSAAAVAAGMVPLAIGSQTNGSVIRPASFCGV